MMGCLLVVMLFLVIRSVTLPGAEKGIFIALAATILPAHAQKFLNDALTLSNVSLWQQGNSLYIGMTVDMANLTIGSARSLSLIPLLTDGQHNVPLQEIIVNGKRREKAYLRGLAISIL